MHKESSPVQIALTPRFKRDLRELAKRYRSIRSDIQLLTEQLQAGEVPGERIAGVKYHIFKVRLQNSTSIRVQTCAFFRSEFQVCVGYRSIRANSERI